MKTRKEIIEWLEDNKDQFINMANNIWNYAEISHREFKSSKLQADFLENEGFKINWNIADLQTAFIAEWGEGKTCTRFYW